MKLRPELFALSLVLAYNVACSSDQTSSDSGVTTPPDAGGGNPDAQEEADSGEVDSGEEPDAGVANTVAPPRRGDMAYAADTATGKVYMWFGDRAEPMMCNIPASDFMDDGWIFDANANTWTKIELDGASPMPLKRARASGAWDAMRNKMIVFGGRYRMGTTGAYTFLKDVWAFDPATNMWSELFAQNGVGGPTGRMNTSLVADPANDRVLVFGGGTTDFATYMVDNQTWAFDLSSNTWTQIGQNGTKPAARLFHSAALDTMRRRMYIFAGGDENAFAGPFLNDAWYLDLAADMWTRVPHVAGDPDGRIKGNMEYDPGIDRLIAFAGHDNGDLGNDNELWTLDPEMNTWHLERRGDTFNSPATGTCDFPADFATVDLESPERRESALFTVINGKVFMHAGRTDCGLANDTWYLDLSNFTWEQVTVSFTGMTCFRSGRTDCNDPGSKKCG